MKFEETSLTTRDRKDSKVPLTIDCRNEDYVAPQARYTSTDYEECFDTEAYLSSYYFSNQDGDQASGLMIPFILNSLHEFFTKGKIYGSSLLELGSGPTITNVISASRHFTHIVCSDVTESNRLHISRWLNDEPNAYDFTPFLKHVTALERGNCNNWEMRELRVRGAIWDVIHCDVLQQSILGSYRMKNFDAIVSVLVLECACRSQTEYKETLKRIAGLINQHGYFLMAGMLRCPFYLVQAETFKLLYLTKDFILSALVEAGLQVMDWRETSALGSHGEAIFAVSAKKTTFSRRFLRHDV